jgi:hypothetical protein
LSKPIKGRSSNFSVRDFFQKHLTETVNAMDGVFFGVKKSDFDEQRRILPFQVFRHFKALSEKFNILGI